MARSAKAALLASALSAFAASAFAAPACLSVPAAKIGLQIYSVRAAVRPLPAPGTPPGTPQAPYEAAKLDAVLGQLQQIGWRNFENVNGDWGLGTGAYKALLDKHQLKAVASHDGLTDETWAATLDRAVALGQTYVGSGGYGAPGLDSLAQVLKTAEHLNKLGEQASAKGLKFYVHNHWREFNSVYPFDLNGDGKTEPVSAWEIIAAKTDPRFVNFEVDVHWARVAYGLDNYDQVLKFLEKYRSRVVLLHIKDTAPDGKYTDLGLGTTDWAKLVTAAGPQIGYYLWENDTPENPMASAKIAYDYMTCKAK
jgi:sugar phosphate isomerase/epimerase